MEKRTQNEIMEMVTDLCSDNGTEQYVGILSIRTSEVREHTKHTSIYLFPKTYGTIRKDPLEVFTIENHSDNAPKVVRFRYGHWVQKFIQIHKAEMDMRDRIKREKEAEKLRQHQEEIGCELSRFLPIDDSFLSEAK